MFCIQQAILNNRGIWEVPKLALRKHLMAEVEQRTNDSSRSPKTSSPSSLITVSAAVAGSPRCLLAIGPLRRTKPTSPAAIICIWPASTNMFHLLSQIFILVLVEPDGFLRKLYQSWHIECGHFFPFFIFRLSSMIIHASVGVAFSVDAGAVDQLHMQICEISSRSLVTGRWI